MKISGKQARKQERVVAKRMGGRTTPASGALPMRKGDVEILQTLGRNFRLDVKTTSKKQYTIKTSQLLKLENDAFVGEIPGLLIVFAEAGLPKYIESWAVIPEARLQELISENS